MGFEYIRKLPTAEEIKESLPLSDKLKSIKQARDNELKQIMTGSTDKFIIIVGPCSANDEYAVCDYVSRLAKVQDKIKDKIMLVPRVYTNKPRTTGEGYKGLMHQPKEKESPNLLEGIKAIRRLHMNVIKESGLTSADEMLYPTNYTYLDDLLGYIAVGARSVENQKHRLTVSGVDIPVGMKNPTSGDFTVMLNSIKAAQIEHTFAYDGHEVNTSGNPLAHAIVRGAVNKHGRNIPNYHYEDMLFLAEKYGQTDLLNHAIIVDCNHANSMKRYDEQPRIAMEVIRNRRYSSLLNSKIKGLMIESYIEDGKQDVGGKIHGKSITDPCLGWDKTERLLFDIANEL